MVSCFGCCISSLNTNAASSGGDGNRLCEKGEHHGRAAIQFTLKPEHPTNRVGAFTHVSHPPMSWLDADRLPGAAVVADGEFDHTTGCLGITEMHHYLGRGRVLHGICKRLLRDAHRFTLCCRGDGYRGVLDEQTAFT